MYTNLYTYIRKYAFIHVNLCACAEFVAGLNVRSAETAGVLAAVHAEADSLKRLLADAAFERSQGSSTTSSQVVFAPSLPPHLHSAGNAVDGTTDAVAGGDHSDVDISSAQHQQQLQGGDKLRRREHHRDHQQAERAQAALASANATAAAASASSAAAASASTRRAALSSLIARELNARALYDRKLTAAEAGVLAALFALSDSLSAGPDACARVIVREMKAGRVVVLAQNAHTMHTQQYPQQQLGASSESSAVGQFEPTSIGGSGDLSIAAGGGGGVSISASSTPGVLRSQMLEAQSALDRFAAAIVKERSRRQGEHLDSKVRERVCLCVTNAI